MNHTQMWPGKNSQYVQDNSHVGEIDIYIYTSYGAETDRNMIHIK
jgi:hypothetical protein